MYSYVTVLWILYFEEKLLICIYSISVSESICAVYCSQGTCVNLSTLDQVSPLHGACMQGNLACAKLLMENGAKVSKASSSGYVFFFVNTTIFKTIPNEDSMF